MISLVLLVMLTLFVLTVINTTNINSRIAGNMQARAEAQAAAQQVLETVMSTNFAANPPGAAGTSNIDVNQDGTNDYQVVVPTPSCTSTVPIKTVQLDISNPDDAACLGSGAVVSGGIVGAGGSGNSLCSNSNWDVQATATDPTVGTGVDVALHQGASIRVPIGTPCP